MSKISVSSPAAGTATYTISAPTGSTDRTLSLPDQTATLITNSADVLNIGSGQFYKDASGNVGIGTTDTANAFVTIKKANASLRFDPGSGGAVIQAVETAVAFRNLTIQSAATIFETNSTERARIDSSGNFFVNATAQSGDAPNNTGIQVSPIGNIKIRVANNGQPAFQFYSPGGGTGGPVGSVTVGASSTAYNTSSDYRLKENVQPMTGALAKVAALNPVTYTWKKTGELDEGFIAHELQEVCPSAVTGEKDATRMEQYEISPAIPATFDKEGNELMPAVEAVMGEREVPVYQGIDTSFLVATLTAAIQELKAIVDAQGAEIAALKGTA